MHIIRISSAAIMEKDIMGKDTTEDTAARTSMAAMEMADVIKQDRNRM